LEVPLRPISGFVKGPSLWAGLSAELSLTAYANGAICQGMEFEELPTFTRQMISLLAVYAKSRKDDLSAAELQYLRQIIENE
jgi:hypothetical protein